MKITRTALTVFGFSIHWYGVLIAMGVLLAILLMNTFAPLIDWFVVQANIKRRLKRAKAVAN